MNETPNIDRLIELIGDCSPVLNVAETVVRMAVTMHTTGHTDEFCVAGGGKNIFVAAVVLTARALGTPLLDARLAVALHMELAGWQTPHSEDVATIVSRIRENGSETFAPYCLVWPIAPATAPKPRKGFTAEFSGAVDDLTATGLTVTELPKAEYLGVPYGTINAWKGGHRSPKPEKQVEIMARLRKLLRQRTAG